jgi:hypothetical protein
MDLLDVSPVSNIRISNQWTGHLQFDHEIFGRPEERDQRTAAGRGNAMATCFEQRKM